jgi:hypothetical protein
LDPTANGTGRKKSALKSGKTQMEGIIEPPQYTILVNNKLTERWLRKKEYAKSATKKFMAGGTNNFVPIIAGPHITTPSMQISPGLFDELIIPFVKTETYYQDSIPVEKYAYIE